MKQEVYTKPLIVFLSLTLAYAPAEAQSCAVPKPLTPAQKEMVGGKWTGHYELDGTKTAFTVTVDFLQFDPVQVSNPPLTGAIDGGERRFCGAGAFHFKKTIGDSWYEFDGVPVGNKMEGALVVLSADGKKSGKFFLERQL